MSVFLPLLEIIYSRDEGVAETENGIFMWNTVFSEDVAEGFSEPGNIEIVKENENYYWKNISIIEKDYLSQIRSAIIIESSRFFILICFYSCFYQVSSVSFSTGIKFLRSILHTLANFDVLTGISNQQFLFGMAEKPLESASRKKETSAILFIDIGGFKPIIDTYGHDAGDFVLQVIAKRLSALLRQSDLISSFEGDEFVLMLMQHTCRF